MTELEPGSNPRGSRSSPEWPKPGMNRMHKKPLRTRALAFSFSGCVDVVNKAVVRRFMTLITLLVAMGITLYLLATASHPLPRTHPPTANEDPSLTRAAAGARMLRSAAPSADGFFLQQLLGMRDGSLCYSYVVQNKPFGGTIVEHAVLPTKSKNLDRSDAAWYHYCAKKTGADLTENIQRLLAD